MISEPIDIDFTNDKEVAGPQKPGIPQDGAPHPRRLSQQTLDVIMEFLLECGRKEPGVWVLLPPELHGASAALAAELPVPILDLEFQTLKKIAHLFRQDDVAGRGALVLNIPSGNGEVRAIRDRMAKDI